LELDIMKAVWRHPPVTVRQVHAAVRPIRNLAYTTVMTIMDRLYHKGFLTRTLQSRTHYYEPSIAYEDAREEALASLVQAYFGGSREELLDFLGGNGNSNESSFHTPNSIDEALL
jgi:predicted transcriptional regulator